MTHTAALEIVWRNPKPRVHEQRWEQVKEDSGTTHYWVRELVFTFSGPLWMITSSLEFVSGGRAA